MHLDTGHHSRNFYWNEIWNHFKLYQGGDIIDKFFCGDLSGDGVGKKKTAIEGLTYLC